jgi:hypothetical protein
VYVEMHKHNADTLGLVTFFVVFLRSAMNKMLFLYGGSLVLIICVMCLCTYLASLRFWIVEEK